MSLEFQRYGRNKDTLINNTYIDSGEYRNKFNAVTDNKDVNRVLYTKAKEMLKHRSGTMLEDMYWIDGTTGEVVASALDEKIESKIVYTKSIKKVVLGKENLITMHTHPNSMPPSAADFNSLFINAYKKGLVLCHNGKVFQYLAKEKIDINLYDAYIVDFVNNGYSEYEAQIATLLKIRKNIKIDFEEVL